ncbi:ribonuclease VapC [Kibdelosporangium banguiense]|uniref:Ribonuclease VapC n=1 Tax=Kibdelosporangium banguiense TaxID=1365924 RepID=A0ABS4TKS2_9PSEU|nr:type II toxin-antitoxin system VapC family toxin [Kibdelosporangium banguiense]MBP2324518.1 ribonuclease VapC [Kibdelosporangium banguiense]
MIVDTSAIIAIMQGEPGHEDLLRSLVRADVVRIGAPTLAETGVVLLARRGVQGRGHLARFVQRFAVETVPFTPQHAEVAQDAYYRFGKGRHVAKLNMGDCFTYATAYVAREPLLFVGDDFGHTDLRSALAPQS